MVLNAGDTGLKIECLEPSIIGNAGLSFSSRIGKYCKFANYQKGDFLFGHSMWNLDVVATRYDYRHLARNNCMMHLQHLVVRI